MNDVLAIPIYIAIAKCLIGVGSILFSAPRKVVFTLCAVGLSVINFNSYSHVPSFAIRRSRKCREASSGPLGKMTEGFFPAIPLPH